MVKFKFNIPIRKVDEEKRLVYGLVTEEIVDQAGEILDYETSKAYFQEWSDSISKATSGNSVGNLRLMHQPVVAGKLIELSFDDALKQISCVAKIVAEDVWALVLEGCLTGFSMGGNYVKRWKDEVDKSVTRFTAKPVEVSVVDNPCVTTATFEYVKSDGSIELRKFNTAGDGQGGVDEMLTNEQILAKAQELAKAAGTPDAFDTFIDEARTLLEGELEMAKSVTDKPADEQENDDASKEAGEGDAEKAAGDEDEDDAEKAAQLEADRLAAAQTLVQVWQAPDGTTHAKKSAAVDHVLSAGTPAPQESEVEKALRIARGEEETTELDAIDADLAKALEVFEAAETDIAPLVKSMYSVRSLSSVITDLRYVISDLACDQSGETSSVPAQLMTHLRGLASTLVTLTEEEVALMISSLGSNYPTILGTVENAVVAEFTKADSPIMQKVGARNSRTDQATIQLTHDNAVLLGATCDCDTTKAATIEKIEDTDLVKTLRADNERLGGEVEKAVAGIGELGELVKGLQEQITVLKNTPQPLPPRTNSVVVERMGRDEVITTETIEKMTQEQRADLAIRISQMAPMQRT